MKWPGSRRMPPYALVMTLVAAIGAGLWMQ